MVETLFCKTPDEMFALGERLGQDLSAGDVVLLFGGLGAGKTLLTKGIVSSLGFDALEVTSPSFSLVNLYSTDTVDVYHIDLWRLDQAADPAGAVGLDEILDEANALVIVEWPERIGEFAWPGTPLRVEIAGDGDDLRTVAIT